MSGKGRGKSEKSLALIEAARRILAEIAPASVRAVCYRLFTEGVIESMRVKETKRVSEQLVWAREQGVIPWAHIVDETRSPERTALWRDPEHIIQAAVDSYRRDYWQDQRERVEVWTEKGTVRGTIAPVLRRYGVPLRVMHGYGSATAVFEAADDTLASDKPTTVLYAGDWDPSGMSMSELDLPGRLARYGGEAAIRRIALIAEDVAPGTALPHFEAETKRGDSRYRWFVEHYGSRCWELDALSPVVLRERVEAEIRKHIDLDLWEHATAVEAAETESMRGFMQAWQTRIFGQVRKYPGGGQ